MKKVLLFLIILFITCHSQQIQAQSWYFPKSHWYDNPLGFSPLDLHTKNGFLIPAIAVGVCLLLTKKDSSLANRLSVYNESGMSWGYKYPYTSLFQNNTGVNYHLRKWMSIGLDVGIYLPHDKFNHTVGFSGRPFARFYPVNNSKFKLYFESGAGLVYFKDHFPKPNDRDDRDGTYLNGTPRYGIGSEIKFDQRTFLMFGARHVHVSNGNTKGSERNPSHDSNGFFIGFSRIF